jgi:hypothetical protein
MAKNSKPMITIQKYLTASIFLIILCLNVSGQTLPSEFKITPVNKMVTEFSNVFDLSSPLKSAVTFSYIQADGKAGLFGKASSISFRDDYPASTAPDVAVSEKERYYWLNLFIKEYISYKDSVAYVISLRPDSAYSVRCFNFENGNWVNVGENVWKTMAASMNMVEQFSKTDLNQLRRVNEIGQVSTDTLAFVNYLKENGKDPVDFLLNKIETHKLVAFGEIHFRKPSWELCTRVVLNKRFAKSAGTIFMEFESNKQDDIDRFFANDTIDRELLLNVFRDYMPNGWPDKARFDFLISLWHLNRTLPESKKIRVVFTDTPRIYTEEGLKNEIQERDDYMAKMIMRYLDSIPGKRNALWIAGTYHVCKTVESAGAMLYKKLRDKMYTVTTHGPMTYNNRIRPQRVRNGMFDQAFYKNGDQPVAFELINSPFGNESFDEFYLEGKGRYKDNYDGYIFLGSLDTEASPAILTEMYDDKFILEMDRRCHLSGYSLKDDWKLDELSVKAVLDVVRSEITPLKWENYLKPLKAN